MIQYSPYRYLILLIIIAVGLSLVNLVPEDTSATDAVILEDEFNGPDNSRVDSNKWDVQTLGTNSAVRIKENHLYIKAYPGGPQYNYAYIESANRFTENSFFAQVDWCVLSDEAVSCKLEVTTNVSKNAISVLSVYHRFYWWVSINEAGGEREINTKISATEYIWYTINVTSWNGLWSVKVWEKSTGSLVFEYTDLDPIPLKSDNHVRLEVGSSQYGMYPIAYYDNFTLQNLRILWNKRPTWASMPTFLAVEDTPLTLDMSGYVHDEDHSIDALMISSSSSYITLIRDMDVTFEFPDGVTEATIEMTLSDPYHSTKTNVTFLITPVNDPPEVNLPNTITLTEDIPYTLDISKYVTDIDTNIAELSAVVDDPYATVDGLTAIITLPEGVLQHRLAIGIRDEDHLVEALITLYAIPVDDPPIVVLPASLELMEDSEYILDLGKSIEDVDTPMSEIRITTDELNCTVDGVHLRFLYSLGGFDDVVTIWVRDGKSTVTGSVLVFINEVNDPPRAQGIPPLKVIEDEVRTMDLSQYISDEDSSIEDLSITSNHEAVKKVEGFTLTILYSQWWPQDTITITISDGISSTKAQFPVTISARNDPPVILTIGDMVSPASITLSETEETSLKIHVSDEDDYRFEYTLLGEIKDAWIDSEGILIIRAHPEDVGEHDLVIKVEDGNGGVAEASLEVIVVNTNDPPSIPVIIRPVNHSRHMEGHPIDLEVMYYDPDISFGQVITILWYLDGSGELFSFSSDEQPPNSLEGLGPGTHRLSVRAYDDEFESSSWVEITIEEEPSPVDGDNGTPGGNPDTDFGIDPFLAVLMIIILFIVGVSLGEIVSRRSRNA